MYALRKGPGVISRHHIPLSQVRSDNLRENVAISCAWRRASGCLNREVGSAGEGRGVGHERNKSPRRDATGRTERERGRETKALPMLAFVVLSLTTTTVAYMSIRKQKQKQKHCIETRACGDGGEGKNFASHHRAPPREGGGGEGEERGVARDHDSILGKVLPWYVRWIWFPVPPPLGPCS